MTYQQVRSTLLGGLDRWCAGQTALLGEVHRWMTARDVTEERRRAAVVRHGSVAAGSALLVGIGGWPVGAAGACWAVAAWRRAPEPPAPLEPPTREEMRREAYLRLFAAAMGDRHGIHLANLYKTLRRFPYWFDWSDAELRALVDDTGVPVQRTMSVGGVTGRSGIRRGDVEALMTGIPVPAPPPTFLPSPGKAGNPSPDREEAAHGPMDRAMEEPVEKAVEPVEIVAMRLEDEPAWP